MNIQKRLYRRYGEYTVYVVDGEAVRDLRPEGDEEFGEWSIHVYFPKLIPDNEIWLEDDLPETEYPFVLANAFTQLRRLSSGASKDAAYEAGNEAERRLRQMRDAELLKAGQVHVRRYVQIGPIAVWLVNGEVIRDRYYVPFIEGGNHDRYVWIPTNEVWLEYTMHPDELPFILIHECVESAWSADGRAGHNGCPPHDLRAEQRERLVRMKVRSFCISVLVPLSVIVATILILGCEPQAPVAPWPKPDQRHESQPDKPHNQCCRPKIIAFGADWCPACCKAMRSWTPWSKWGWKSIASTSTSALTWQPKTMSRVFRSTW